MCRGAAFEASGVFQQLQKKVSRARSWVSPLLHDSLGAHRGGGLSGVVFGVGRSLLSSGSDENLISFAVPTLSDGFPSAGDGSGGFPSLGEISSVSRPLRRGVLVRNLPADSQYEIRVVDQEYKLGVTAVVETVSSNFVSWCVASSSEVSLGEGLADRRALGGCGALWVCRLRRSRTPASPCAARRTLRRRFWTSWSSPWTWTRCR